MPSCHGRLWSDDAQSPFPVVSRGFLSKQFVVSANSAGFRGLRVMLLPFIEASMPGMIVVPNRSGVAEHSVSSHAASHRADVHAEPR